uniref:phosphopyruvate hydratase n=1 Tax=Corvus moneduloides TaxID=1196302 RepID=A0A8C3DJH1_CORMO
APGHLGPSAFGGRAIKGGGLQGFGGPRAIWVLVAPGLSLLGWGFRGDLGIQGEFRPSSLGALPALELLKAAIGKAGYMDEVAIGMDTAFFITGEQLGQLYQSFIKDYPDPFDQDDRDGWKQFLTQADIQVVDNDLTATNPKLIARAAKLQARSCLLLKVNQIRLVTKSIRACKLAQSYSWGVMVSHRSGETEDTFISDLVVGLCAGQIQTGAPCCSKHLAKYNQLMRIEEVLGDGAKFTGRKFQNPKAT